MTKTKQVYTYVSILLQLHSICSNINTVYCSGCLSCIDHQPGNNRGTPATTCILPMTAVLTVAHTTSGGYYSSGCLVGLPSGCKHRLLASHQCYGSLQFMLHCVAVKE